MLVSCREQVTEEDPIDQLLQVPPDDQLGNQDTLTFIEDSFPQGKAWVTFN